MERSAAWREAVQKTKRYRRRVREPGGTEHTSTRGDCNDEGWGEGETATKQKGVAMDST